MPWSLSPQAPFRAFVCVLRRALRRHLAFEFGETNKKNNAQERGASRRKIAGLEENKDRLFDALAEGLIDDRVALNGKIARLNGDIESLEQRYKSLNLDADQFLMRAGEVVDRLRELPLAFLEAESPKQKAAILREMADGVRLIVANNFGADSSGSK